MNSVFADLENTGEQFTLSENLQNDPVSQDILKKIEIVKKMIKELQQKEYEENQAQENLEQRRTLAIASLTQDLVEWERMWEKHSSRNSFDSFVSKRPDYVQGVFWDQFEFKEQKINAGRIVMNDVLINGGTVQDAKNAYHRVASASKIELIEMNSQFNVKHNLADYEEQQVFNSTGQIHLSSATQSKLSQFYNDYKLQPNYILANSDDKNTSKSKLEINLDTQCGDGLVLVSRITSETFSCIDESIAKKWASAGVTGITIHDESISNTFSNVSKVKINPGTNCDDGYQVIYDFLSSEYQCVLDTVAKDMLDNNTAEIHTLTEYILNKDKQKTTDDVIFKINQNILQINAEYSLKKGALESKYDDLLKDEKSQAKQEMQIIIKEYKIDKILTKEDVTKLISKIRKTSDHIQEKIVHEKLDALNDLESKLKHSISKIVKRYENNSNINVDWSYLIEPPAFIVIPSKEKKTSPISVLLTNENISEKIHLDNFGLVNSFGQKFDEIKSDHVLQVSADVTNFGDNSQDFVYLVEVKNDSNEIVQPAKWITGTLNPEQTLNVGLSWIPKETGHFRAIISTGEKISSVSQIAEVTVDVNPKGDVSD